MYCKNVSSNFCRNISNYRSCSSYHKTFCTITFIIVTIFSFSTPAVAEEVATGAITDEIVLVAGKLPDAAITEGDWVWDEAVVQDGIISHTDLSHEGRNTRSFTTSSKVSLGENSKVVQYIFLDAENPPLGIMLKLKIEGLEDAISLYWEGDKEVFADMNEYITAWYMGVLPEAGKWVELIIDCKELELEKAGLSGMSFIAHEGKVWWGKTIIKEVEYVKEKT